MSGSAADKTWRSIAAAWLLLFVALWPFPALAEAALSLGALAALVVVAVRRGRGRPALLAALAWRLCAAIFLGYWLPELLSAFDALDAPRAWRETAMDLRYLPFLGAVALAVSTRVERHRVFVGLALIGVFWSLDAAVQAATGWSLRGQNHADRLTGLFGDGNLKLGLVLASLSPFALHAAFQRRGFAVAALVAMLFAIVILLAGARAAWLTYALVVIALLWTHVPGWRPRAGVLATILLAFAVSAAFSPLLQQRLQRTAAIFHANSAGLDQALSWRWSIWRAATGMVLAHPINGVGVRGFRLAYASYAPAGAPFLGADEQGAFHAHQLLLEVLSETGVIGLSCWCLAAWLAWRAWRAAAPTMRRRAWPATVALAVTVFPFNTHLAFYSNFWGGVFLCLAGLFAGALLSEQDDASGDD